MSKAFLPNSFTIPKPLKTENFSFKVLDETLANLDYEAVMSSQERLVGIFGPSSTWPKVNMTIKENIASLKVHKAEFDTKKAFAYSVFNSSQDKCLGSVYIDSCQSKNYDCEVYFWMRDDSLNLEEELYKALTVWLKSAWPFESIAFPGKLISWERWAMELTAV